MDAEVQSALERASQAEDRESLWRAIEPLRDRLTKDPDVARAWAEALRTSPARRTLEEEAEAIADAFPGDADIVGAVCDALIRAAERRPIDEPPLSAGGAAIAAGAADRCFAKLSEQDREDADIGGRLLALRGNALKLLGPNRYEDAVDALTRALALDPDRSEWHYDLALAHKHRRTWSDALASLERTARDRKPIWWNLAIAATAMGDGDRACRAWRALGIE